MSTTKREWPQEIRKPVQLGNFRPPVSERRPPAPFALHRPGMDPLHLAILRRMPCAVCPAISRIDPHHLKSGPAARERAFGRRATDRWAVPICRFHHNEVERAGGRGEIAWFARWGLDPHDLAKALWEARRNFDRTVEIIAAHKRLAIRGLKEQVRLNELVEHRLITAGEAAQQYAEGLWRR